MGWTVCILNPGGSEIFCSHTDQHWGLPKLLYSRYQVSFPEEKAPGHGVDHPPPHPAPKLKKE